MGHVVLITGSGGLLGGEVTRRFEQTGAEVHAFSRSDLDVRDVAAVRAAMSAASPSLVVHCAAMTNVDACELDPDAAFAVNAVGAANVAGAAASQGAEVVSISTDYVFDGRKGLYTEDDRVNPIQVYGRSKLEGERLVRAAADRHYILRSAWIYGDGGKNFLSRLPEMSRAGRTISAVVDQRGSPTYAPDLAAAIAMVAASGAYGTYHVVNTGVCSFAEFCRHGLHLLASAAGLEEVSLADLGRPAPRPEDTSLVGDAWRRAGFEELRSWQEAATDFLG